MWDVVAKGAVGYLAKSQAAKTQAAWDRYNNKMAGIQAGQAENAISANVALNKAQNARNRVGVEQSRLMAAAKVKAGAAASGVAGASVEDTIFDIGRNAGNRLHNEQVRFSSSLLASDQQRRGVAMQRATSQRAVTKGPSLLGAFASTGLSILESGIDLPSSQGTELEGAMPESSSPSLDIIKNMLNI